MAEIKWIKLSVNMFDDEKIKLIRTMPEGDSIALVWIQILCLAGRINDGGWVYMGQNLAYSDEMLATILGHPLNTMRIALKTLEDFGLIDISSDGKIDVTNWEKHQSTDKMARVASQNRERQQKYYYRTKLRELGVNVDEANFTNKLEELKNMYEELSSDEKPNVRLTLPNETEVRSKKLEVRSKKLEVRSKKIDVRSKKIEVNNNNSNSSRDDEIQKVFQFFEENIGMATSYVQEELLHWVNDLDVEVVQEAIKVSVEMNIKNYKYINGVLKNWVSRGVKNIQDVRALQVEHENKKNRKNYRRSNTYKEPLPESMQNKVEHQEEVSVESEEELRKRLAEVFSEE